MQHHKKLLAGDLEFDKFMQIDCFCLFRVLVSFTDFRLQRSSKFCGLEQTVFKDSVKTTVSLFMKIEPALNPAVDSKKKSRQYSVKEFKKKFTYWKCVFVLSSSLMNAISHKIVHRTNEFY